MSSKTIDLNDYLVPGTTNTYYIPEFITEDEEEYLIRKIDEAPQPWWKRLQNRSPDIIGRIRDTGAFKSSAHGQPNHVIMNEYAPGQGIMVRCHPSRSDFHWQESYHLTYARPEYSLTKTVFHYYKYKTDTTEGASPQAERSAGTTTAAGPMSATGSGKPIDPTPILSLLLEPRSLVITTSSLYTSHLHGIDEVQEDRFEADGRTPQQRIANYDMLRSQQAKEAIANGGKLERGMRFSLTCRDVEKVAAGGGALFKKLRG
ncbi:hypothetical protein ACG7TL_007751 [Trametes sanguinea]